MSKPANASLSPTQLRLRRFKRLKRGYYSFLVLAGSYLLTFLLPFLMSDKAVVVRYEGSTYFPAFRSYMHETFGNVHDLYADLTGPVYSTIGADAEDSWIYRTLRVVFIRRVYQAEVFDQDRVGEPDYRALDERFANEDGNWLWLPIVPYSPNENFDAPPGAKEEDSRPPYPPSSQHWLGSDDSGRDLFVRLAYGYRISISFALVVVIISYAIGIMMGAILGYFGRWVDILGQRLVEIWGAIPFLYTIIIISSILEPKFIYLAFVLAAFGWMSISYYIRGEFYREKAKDYVAAAIATGESHFVIMFRHILPNALTPVITFAPFAIVSSIISLVALDFLGFGLQPPTPSWGELIGQGRNNLGEWHIVVFPIATMFITLQLIVFVGEAVREAFDPKVFSRIR